MRLSLSIWEFDFLIEVLFSVQPGDDNGARIILQGPFLDATQQLKRSLTLTLYLCSKAFKIRGVVSSFRSLI